MKKKCIWYLMEESSSVNSFEWLPPTFAVYISLFSTLSTFIFSTFILPLTSNSFARFMLA